MTVSGCQRRSPMSLTSQSRSRRGTQDHDLSNLATFPPGALPASSLLCAGPRHYEPACGVRALSPIRALTKWVLACATSRQGELTQLYRG